MEIFKTTLKTWSSETSSISPLKNHENKSKQRVSVGVAMTTNVVPLHAVMITPRHRAGVSTLFFSFFSCNTKFPLTEPLSEQVTTCLFVVSFRTDRHKPQNNFTPESKKRKIKLDWRGFFGRIFWNAQLQNGRDKISTC